MTEKRSSCGYDNHGNHQHGWYIVTSDYPNYISRDEVTIPACQDIRDTVNHDNHHNTYGEKHVQQTEQKAWFMKEHVHYSKESINAEADEFIQLKHKYFEMSKMPSFGGF